MTVTTALLWVGALAALVIIARRLGCRSRHASYPFRVAPLVLVAVGAAGLWLAARFRATT